MRLKIIKYILCPNDHSNRLGTNKVKKDQFIKNLFVLQIIQSFRTV